jgi:hypothetical protein
MNQKSQRPYVDVFNDEVVAKSPDSSEFVKVEDGDYIEVGSVVKTSQTGRAQVVFPNGTVTRLDFSSEITLSSYQAEPFKAKIAISKGRIWSAITKLLGSETYQTQSDSVVASVRGTSYGHDVSAGPNTLQVSKGTVEGICLNQKQKAMIEAGNEAVFNCQTANTNVVHRLDTSNQGAWFNFNSNQDERLKKQLEAKDFQDNVLGETAKPTGNGNAKGPKVKLTPTPAPSGKPGDLSTPKPSKSPTPEPTPSPTPVPSPSPTKDPCVLPNGKPRPNCP